MLKDCGSALVARRAVCHSGDATEHLVYKPHATSYTSKHTRTSSQLFLYMFSSEDVQQLTAALRGAAADCLEQDQLVQEYHLVVLM